MRQVDRAQQRHRRLTHYRLGPQHQTDVNTGNIKFISSSLDNESGAAFRIPFAEFDQSQVSIKIHRIF